MVIMRSQLKNERGNIYINYTTMRPSDATKKALKQILGIKKNCKILKSFCSVSFNVNNFFLRVSKKLY